MEAAPFPTPGLPEGEVIELPGRGTTFVRQLQLDHEAPTLLLLHGWTANSALNWFATYEPLATRFNVIALDHRGHGHGIRHRHRFSLVDCADDAAALLKVLDRPRAIAVGYSMGGPIATLLWRRHRSLVDGLVLCATTDRFREPGRERLLRAATSTAATVLRAAPRWAEGLISSRLLTSRYDDTALGRWAREQAMLNDLRAVIEAGHAIGSFDGREWYPQIDVPTAVIVTERDTTVPPARQLAMAELIRDASVRRVDGRHDACATRPERFVPALAEACADVADRARARRPN